jgi:hypothetical protein
MAVNPTDDADLDRSTIYHLNRIGWSFTQIAEAVEIDPDTVMRVLREAPEGVGAAVAAAPPLAIRLTKDARRLRIVLPSDALREPTSVVLGRITEHCAIHHIDLALTQEDLEERLRTCVYGSWLTIGEATPSTPTVDERVRILVPVITGREKQRREMADYVVRSGTVLAEIEPGRLGEPGKDLLGKEISARPPRRARLPIGENTLVDEQGTHLIAACDGLVTMRRLRLHVQPLTIHEGDLKAGDGVLRAEGSIIITGGLQEDASVIAEGDVEVWGSVQGAGIESVNGHVTVRGVIGGTALKPAVLRAAGTITCDTVRHAELRAGIDIMVGSSVHHARIESKGDLRLPQEIERTLFNVQLLLDGAVIAPVGELAPPSDAPTERRHARAAVALLAQIAVYGPPPLTFASCVLEDLSPGGARCKIAAPLSEEPLEANRPVQLKFSLPGRDDQIIVIARVAHVIASDTLGLAFLQITERHADQVVQWYLELLRSHKAPEMGNPADRKGDRRFG